MTGRVVMAKVFVVVPWPTEVEPGTTAAAELLLSVTGMPPLGAGLPRVMRPVDVPGPPFTMLGVIVRAMVSARTTIVVVAALPEDVRAVIVTVRSTFTCDVVMTNWC